MKSRTSFMLPVLLLLVVGTPIVSAEPESEHEVSQDAPSKQNPQIAKWISQLGSDKFTVREQATQALTKAGSKALPAVIGATRSKEPEIRNRALKILRTLSISDDEATASAVRRAAEAILQSQDPRSVAQAKKILEYQSIHRTALAKQIFRKLGAKFRTSRKYGNFLNLRGTPVTDEHMARLKWLTKLNRVDLKGTQVTDAGLEHLQGVTKLETLDLSDTKITNAGLEHLKGLKSLAHLNLSNTNVTGAGLERLKGLPKLRELFLQGTNVADVGLKHLNEIKSLQTLWLYNTKITDAGLEHLKGLKSLRSLGLTNTNVTDEGVKKLQKALPDCRISR